MTAGGPVARVDRVAGGPLRVALASSHLQGSEQLDDDTVVIGYMGDAGGRPLAHVPAGERLRTVEANLAPGAAATGSWTALVRRDGQLVLRTDLFGTRPLFWRDYGDRIEIHEDIWALAAGAELDPLGVADMLLVGHHVGDRTMFAGVRCTLGNSLVTLAPGDVRERFYDWPPPAPTGPSLDEAATALEHSLDGLFDPYRQLGGLLMPLSGGLDSRTLLALAVDQGIPVEAWTFVMRSGTLEERIARSVARRLGVPHVVSAVAGGELAGLAPGMVRATSGQLSLEHAHVYGAHPSAPGRYGVSVNGIYGDVVCGGSWLGPSDRDAAMAAAQYLHKLVGQRRLDQLQARLPGVPGWADRLRSLAADWFARAGNDPRRSDLIVVANRPSRFNIWGSIATRRAFDYIAPFLDPRLLAVAYGMPERWQRDSIAYKDVIARRWPRLARIPWAQTGLPVAGSYARVLRYRVERRLAVRPREFTAREIYVDAFGPLVDEALGTLAPPLARAGIDLEGLCADHPAGISAGDRLRLRAATCLLAFRQAATPLP